jgi:hypothetical protein
MEEYDVRVSSFHKAQGITTVGSLHHFEPVRLKLHSTK